MSFRGALIRKTSDQSISSGTFTTLAWGASIYDTDSFWSAGSNSRLTIPAGVSAVQLTTGVRWASGGSNSHRITEPIKNGAGFFRGGGGENYRSPDAARTRQSVPLPPIQVSEGDYFEWRVWQDSGGTRTVEDVEETFTSVRAIESLKGALVYRTSDYPTSEDLNSIPWQASEYDTDGIWNSGEPTRLTVPSGSTRVRLYGGIIWSTGTGNREIFFRRNGGSFQGGAANGYPMQTGGGRCRQVVTSPIITVSPGDYFELGGNFTGSVSSIEHDGGARTYFAMEVPA